jgi:hypothetical protein
VRPHTRGGAISQQVQTRERGKGSQLVFRLDDISLPIRTMGFNVWYEPSSVGRDVAVGVESGEQSKEAQ